MVEIFRRKCKDRIVIVFTADEFSPKRKGYVIQESLKKGDTFTFFGNPFGVTWGSRKDAIEQAKLRCKLSGVL